MTPLRQKMIRELELRRTRPKPSKSTSRPSSNWPSTIGAPPTRLPSRKWRDYLHFLITQRQLALTTVNQQLSALRFFYVQVLRVPNFDLRVPSKRRPLSSRATQSLRYRPPVRRHPNRKHRALLMTAYAPACA